MKRFWKEAAVTATDAGFAVSLDGRPLKTPARATLVVPTQALADAIADEWNAVTDKVDPRAMPLTGLANAAIDRIAPDRDAHVTALARYGESDLVAYRAEHPADLVAHQEMIWGPLVAWVRARFDIDFLVTSGIMHKPQPEATLARLRDAVDRFDDFSLAALNPLVTISGSLVIALALAEGALTLDAAWAAGQLDELWQIEKWGEDTLAAQARATRRADFGAAAKFLDLLKKCDPCGMDHVNAAIEP